jgi:hypothetical protein
MWADDFVGQASVIDGDTPEIHGTRSRLWASTAPKAPSCAEVQTAICIGVAQSPRMISILSSCDDRSTAGHSPRTDTGGWGRHVPSVAPISGSGLFAMVSRWIGRSIRRGGTTPSCVTRIVQAAGCGQAATWSHGCIAYASGRAVARPTVQMTRTHVLKHVFMRRIGASAA